MRDKLKEEETAPGRGYADTILTEEQRRISVADVGVVEHVQVYCLI